MREIEVTGGGGACVVTVVDGGDRSEHRVTVPDRLVDRLGGTVDEETLVRESFAFLLEREPAASILAEFSLDVISRYFPEYDAEIARRVA